MARKAYDPVMQIAALLLCGISQALAAQPAGAAAAADKDIVLRVIDSAGTPLPQAVVWFAGEHAAPAQATEPAIVDQIDKQFVPELTVIRSGTEVQFPNSDAVSHHVYSFAQPNSFELPLYKGESRPVIRFDHAGVVTLGCNIHDSMLGYIVVVDTPHYAITDQDGYARFAVPPSAGADMFVWSPRIDPAEPVNAATVSVAGASGVVQVARRQRPAPKPFSGSLAWEEY